MNETVASLIRAVLKFVGGFIIAKGIASESQLTDITGAVITITGIVWGIVAARKASADNPEKQATQSASKILRNLALLFFPAILLSGCALLGPNAQVMKALAGDTNSVDITITTLYGTINVKRNMDRFSAPTPTVGESVVVTPVTTLQTQRLKN